MELVYTLKGLDCPNCSAKIEKEVGALEQITDTELMLLQSVQNLNARAVTEQLEKGGERNIALLIQKLRADIAHNILMDDLAGADRLFFHAVPPFR